MVAMMLLLFVMSFWIFVECDVIKKRYTNKKNVSKQAKANNLWLVFITLFCFINLYVSFFTQWHDERTFYWSYVGSLISFSGLLMRKIAIKTLGKHFDGLVQFKKNQELIQHGLYRYFRHPSYTGTIVTFFGFGMASMSIVNTILFPFLFTICYYFRTQFEEGVLTEGFGDEYKKYKAKTWGLLPWFKKNSW
ncbi:TPA: isoprenylcysteine carboxylmethyltransferase family protein [Bacillus cereus]|nr:isoprenylcysteine carboxylmethyltransferase family protein [Bacillus cereus]